MFSSGGIASADSLVGQRYSDASSTITGWGGTPIVSTVSGSQVAQADCLVSSWHKAIFRDSSGNSKNGQYLLNLDCNQALATPGHPGNSAMSPQGRQKIKDDSTAKYIAKNPSMCDKDQVTGEWCERVCNRTGLCSFAP